MEIWHVILIAEVVIAITYIKLLKKYPIIFMPFDYQYRVIKRAYRAYAPVREGKKLYKVFAEDFLCGYKRSVERNENISSQEYIVANRICNMIEKHQGMVERYFSGKFGYFDFLNMKSEYDLYQEQVVEAVNEELGNNEPDKSQRSITLRQKVLLFISLFDVCNVDVSNTQKARFIRDLLEVEPNTKDISNTNTYKYIKNSNKELLAAGEIAARIKDYKYVVKQLEHLELEKQCSLILNEIKELENSILE